MYQVFYQVEKLYKEEKYQIFENFWFSNRVNSKIFGFRQCGKKIQFFYDRDRFVQYNIDHIMQTSFTALYNQGVNVILLYWCRSSDLITFKRQKSELAKGYATLPTPLLSFSYIRLHDWICMYVTLFDFLCTKFLCTR